MRIYSSLSLSNVLFFSFLFNSKGYVSSSLSRIHKSSFLSLPTLPRHPHNHQYSQSNLTIFCRQDYLPQFKLTTTTYIYIPLSSSLPPPPWHHAVRTISTLTITTHSQHQLHYNLLFNPHTITPIPPHLIRWLKETSIQCHLYCTNWNLSSRHPHLLPPQSQSIISPPHPYQSQS